MILYRYLTTKFLKYFAISSITLTALYSFIDFFEKLSRCQSSTFKTIITFIALNTLPSFFDLISVSTYLATCLLIKDLIQNKDLEAFSLLGIKFSKFIKFSIVTGISIFIFSFVGKEILILKISSKTDQFRLENFKANIYQKIFDQWFYTSDSTFAHVLFLDLNKNTGENLEIFFMNSVFNLEKRIYFKKFSIDIQKKEIIGENGELSDFNNSEIKKISSFYYPELFAQIKLALPQIGIYKTIKFLNEEKFLSKRTKSQELINLFSKVISHFDAFLYLLLIFCLLFAAISSINNLFYYLAIIFSYPIFTAATKFSYFLAQHSLSPYVVFIPYFLIFSLIFILFYKNHHFNY